MNRAGLELLQEKLAQKVLIPARKEGFHPEEKHILFTLDIQYTEKYSYIALDISYFSGEEIALYMGKSEISAEYVPQFFCFREGPPLIGMIEAVRAKGYTPDLILIDGHGLAHPRKFGVACYVGIEVDVPTIGCAKRHLIQPSYTPDLPRGSVSPIENERKVLGYALRTQDGVNPVFVSPGHKISLENAAAAVLSLASVYRLPEPIRRADQAARLYAKGEPVINGIDLGTILPHKI